eukprot:9358457-Alexandrium_andersonii.AAC.1
MRAGCRRTALMRPRSPQCCPQSHRMATDYPDLPPTETQRKRRFAMALEIREAAATMPTGGSPLSGHWVSACAVSRSCSARSLCTTSRRRHCTRISACVCGVVCSWVEQDCVPYFPPVLSAHVATRTHVAAYILPGVCVCACPR